MDPQSDLRSSTTDACLSREQLHQRMGRVSVALSVSLCHRSMKLSEFVALGPGAVIAFEAPCTGPLELKADRATIAIGQAVHTGRKIALRLDKFVDATPNY
jgi:flagellar motor switch/type III secretory pathway protein FliN